MFVWKQLNWSVPQNCACIDPSTGKKRIGPVLNWCKQCARGPFRSENCFWYVAPQRPIQEKEWTDELVCKYPGCGEWLSRDNKTGYCRLHNNMIMNTMRRMGGTREGAVSVLCQEQQ